MFISIGIDENGKPFVTTSDNQKNPAAQIKGTASLPHQILIR